MKRIYISILALGICALSYAQADTLYLGYDQKTSKDRSALSADGVTGEQVRFTDSANPLNSLYGLIPGLNVMQGENIPGGDDPNLFIRGLGSFNGNNVLILVDGLEREASLVSPDEIESVTVLKDAAATAVYGNRGADGVICITTKRGKAKGLCVRADYTFGLLTPYKTPSMVDNYTYATALNKALANDGLTPMYTEADLINIKTGARPDVFPNINWKDEVLKSTGHTNNLNVSLDGSKGNTNLYLFLNFNDYRGYLNNSNLNEGYTTQIEQTSIKARANIDTKLTKTTFVRINIMGSLSQYQEPCSGHSLDPMYNTPSLAFPVNAEDGRYITTTNFYNPVRQIAGGGIVSALKRSLYADLTIDQKLDFWTPGLYIKGLIGYDNSATINDNKVLTTSWYQTDYLRDSNGNIYDRELTLYGSDTGTSFVSYLSSQYMTFTGWAQAGYDRTFGDHGVDAYFVACWERQKFSGQNNIYLYNDYILSANYSWKNRLFFGVSGTFSGSAKLSMNDKYRFYPAVSLGYIACTEPFIKVRGSYGVAGNDRHLTYDMDQQFNGAGNSYIYSGFTTVLSGLKEGDLPSSGIEPERDYKSDLGFEARFLRNRLSMQVDGFFNDRRNICVSGSGDYSSMIGIGLPKIFTGHAYNYGVELSLGWQDKVGDFSYHINANTSFARNKILEMAEEYHPEDCPYMYYTGNVISAQYGLTSDGFYTADDFQADGSLKPGVVSTSLIDPSQLRPGDAKYVDKNGDGTIDSYDYSYFGSSLPNVLLGLQFGLQYKNFGAEFAFNGAFGGTVMTTLSSVYRPLYGNDKNISEYALANSWSEDNQNAKYPRLTTLSNAHNYAASDMWMARLDYFKLRNVYLWYSIKEPWMQKIKMSEFRVFLRGNNLCSIDSIQLFDPEYISLGYPSARSFQVGLKVGF